MPISRSTVLWGHVLTSLVSNAFTVVVIILVAFHYGLSIIGGGALAVVGILALFTLALLRRLPDCPKISGRCKRLFHPLVFLPFICSAFVPTESMPSAVRAFAENQPVTPIVGSIRALLSSQQVGNDIWIALGWRFGILMVAYTFAIRAYKKRV
nr:ABC transporter permease [Peribacillus simplex]